MKFRRGVVLALILPLALAGAPIQAQTQTQDPPKPPPPATTQIVIVPDLVTDLARIRAGLNRPPSLKVRQEGVRFYLTILGERIDIHEYLKNSDLKFAPVPRAGVTHQDFINHVTPRLLYSSGGIKATELLEWGIVNWLGQMAIKKAVSKIGGALQDAELRRIREQIDRELAALRGK